MIGLFTIEFKASKRTRVFTKRKHPIKRTVKKYKRRMLMDEKEWPEEAKDDLGYPSLSEGEDAEAVT